MAVRDVAVLAWLCGDGLGRLSGNECLATSAVLGVPKGLQVHQSENEDWSVFLCMNEVTKRFRGPVEAILAYSVGRHLKVDYQECHKLNILQSRQRDHLIEHLLSQR